MESEKFENVTWVIVAFAALSIVGVPFGLWVAWRFLKKLLGLWQNNREAFGEDTKVRLLSLGLASLFFSGELSSFISALISFFYKLALELPTAMAHYFPGIVQACGKGTPLGTCLGQATGLFFRAWHGALSTAFSAGNLANLPYGQLVLLLALWVLVAQLFGSVSATQTANGTVTKRAWIFGWFDSLKSATRQNLLFFIILALAGYLCMAAITAIPGLQETASVAEEVSPERLKEQLDSVQRQAELRIQKEYSAPNPFSELEEFLKQADQPAETNSTTPNSPSDAAQAEQQPAPAPTPANKPANAPRSTGAPNPTPAPAATATPASTPAVEGASAQKAPALTPEQLARLRNGLNFNKLMREGLLGSYQQLQNDARTQLNNLNSLLVTTYQTSNLGRKGNREKSQHFLTLSSYFYRRVSEIESRLNSCGAGLANVDTVFRSWSSIPRTTTEIDFGLLYSERVFEVSRVAQDQCRSGWGFEAIPDRPALGSYLGPFGVVASWLLKTESLPLALIIGMLGFGLLGSACSSFVREQFQKSSDEGAKTEAAPLVSNLTGVIIRGLSAAIVVFLAVEGGLAIFASSGSEPNSYVLLLTCLVAAVFSEDVWDWAHDKLLAGFTGNEEHAGETESPAPTNGATVQPPLTATPATPPTGSPIEPTETPRT